MDIISTVSGLDQDCLPLVETIFYSKIKYIEKRLIHHIYSTIHLKGILFAFAQYHLAK